MRSRPVDLDELARQLRARMDEQGLSLRAAAVRIGVSPATLSRMLHGSKADIVPDTATLARAADWIGKSLSSLTGPAVGPGETSSLADVEVHLRALPGLAPEDAEAIMALVKAAYEVRATTKKRATR